MQKASAAKVKQVTDLMKLLHLRTEVRTKMNQQGFIEDMVFWIDDEEYPSTIPIPAVDPAPTGETGKDA